MNRTIKGPALEHMKKLIENPRDSLTPKPSWHPDPRSVIDQPEERKRYSPLSFTEDQLNDSNFCLFGNYD